MKQVLPHAGEQRFRRLEIRPIAANDKGERPGGRTGDTARDRGIDKAQTAGAGCLPDLTGRVDIDSGAVDHQCTNRQGCQQILPLRQPKVAHMLPRR